MTCESMRAIIINELTWNDAFNIGCEDPKNISLAVSFPLTVFLDKIILSFYFKPFGLWPTLC